MHVVGFKERLGNPRGSQSHTFYLNVVGFKVRSA